MLDKTSESQSVNSGLGEGVEKPAPGEFAWGSAEIGEVIGRTPRQTHHLLSRGQILCAKKKGGRWVANRAALRREFGG